MGKSYPWRGRLQCFVRPLRRCAAVQREGTTQRFRVTSDPVLGAVPWKSLTPLTGHADGGEQGRSSSVYACYDECYDGYMGDMSSLVPGKGLSTLPPLSAS